MSDTTTSLPSHTDYVEGLEALQEAYNRLEALVWALEPVGAWQDDQSGEPPLRPSLADVGELYSFIAGVEIELDQSRQQLELLRRRLADLDLMRIETA